MDAETKRRAAAVERVRRWRAENPERAKAAAHRCYEATKQLVGRPTGPKHHAWKGENASYYAIHIWITSQRGRPSVCEHCGILTAKKYEWANIDHRYERKLDQYIRLCTSCHRKYDYANGLCEKGGPRPKS